MAAVIYLLTKLLPEGRLVTFGLIVVGIVVYVAVSLLIGSLKKEEIKPLLKRLKK